MFKQLADRDRIRNIGVSTDRSYAKVDRLCGRALGSSKISIHQNQMATRLRQRNRGGLSKPLGGTRDDRDTVF
jgi:hypothetical protein